MKLPAITYTPGKVASPGYPCGMGNENAEHVLKVCPLHSEDRPTNWQEISPNHLAYMEATTKKLWVIENPNFIRRQQE